MSHLDKLAIRGVRSFDDKQIAVIQFFSPVTVIVGHNGSGKTTIIECLKYATTGDQPPGTRGGAFVHDPKMANEKEVKAQVKLRFQAANGTEMLAVRNLSVTMKKNGAMTMKTLESILGLANANLEKGGKRGVISTKCAEMDTEIPHLLGVSRAVLENVIFCHQEDSYWPLAEPAALKKKFDDIFEATKYTKALDSIKSLRKDRVAELKAEKERLELLSHQKGQADKIKNRISDLASNIASKEIEHEDTKQKLEELIKSNQKFFERSTTFREAYVRVQNLQEAKERYLEDLKEARANVQEVSGKFFMHTDDELQQRLTNFNEHIAKQKRLLREHEAKEEDADAELISARRRHVELINEHGQLAAEAKAQETRMTEREDLVRELASLHGIRGFEASPLDRDQVTDFTSRLDTLQRQKTVETERIQEENRAKEAEYVSKSRQLHTELKGFEHQRTTNRERISELQSDISVAESKVEAAETVEGELETHIADIQEKEARIEKMKLEIASAKYDERMLELNGKTRELESKRDAFTQEIRTLSLQADQRAKLGLHQSSQGSKEREMNKLLQLNNVKFRKFVGADANAETMESKLDHITSEFSSRGGVKSLYDFFIRNARDKEKCVVVGLKQRMEKTSEAELQVEIREREADVDRLQGLVSVEATRDHIRDIEIPDLQRKIKEEKSLLSKLEETANQANDKVAVVKKELKDLATLRGVASNVSRLHLDLNQLKKDIAQIESDLSSTGSTKTPDDVQQDLDEVSAELRAIDREKQTAVNDRERRNNTLRTHQNELHTLQLQEKELRNRLREKDSLQKDIGRMRQDIVSLTSNIKDLDGKIADGQGPIDALEREHGQVQKECSDRLSVAQEARQTLNISTRKLEDANKSIERYIREKRARKLQECTEKIERYESQISDHGVELDRIRKLKAQIEKEVNEGGASLASLRENLRIRKLLRDIATADQELEMHDMEEMAKAKRTFDIQYPIKKQEETNLQGHNAHLGGVLSSSRNQLKDLEEDLKEFKNINKKYTEQLVKVKMSDMANNDLEKYGKALDNAIMKYHSLKMEEVNDTMRHLWNKTYQGTDIDGIKIRSDSEGGATKRSYNYRVVMTKDQVEMDMRGRCSAGQKMLASIIIRLALSDSFGQNCGILALDEPTNALDTENIDALAASLVDIINERKNHSNFQLIIITHDENFLRKLGQSDVMEYYW
ncbi:AAA domain-containing protein [Amylostereum chailletii]|nr:AAA domain-containing protein [Amylostereum chailletii]